MKFAVGFALTVAVVGVIGIWWAGYLGEQARLLYEYVSGAIEEAKR